MNDDVLNIKTVQISPVRTMVTALKDIIMETNVCFSAEGMRIVTFDKSSTVLVNLILRAEDFEYYNCTQEKIIISLNMIHLFKLINSIDNNDTLTIYIEKNDYNDGIVSFLSLKFENNSVKQCKIQKLRLIEPDPVELVFPDVEFSSIINLPSSDFQKVIRDLVNISDTVEIKSVGDELLFNCVGSFASVELRRSENKFDNGGEGVSVMEFKKRQEIGKIVQGIFPLKILNYFIKCTNLCDQIELFLENDLPLVVKYNIASLGEIKLCVSPLPAKVQSGAF
jgi:proliferating cell nuclear antigen